VRALFSPAQGLCADPGEGESALRRRKTARIPLVALDGAAGTDTGQRTDQLAGYLLLSAQSFPKSFQKSRTHPEKGEVRADLEQTAPAEGRGGSRRHGG
jgi:hypothetical protein